MALRPYQQEFLQAVQNGHAAGERKQVGVLPTGAGKCVTPDTLVWSNGLKRFGDLFCVGDSIMSHERPQRIVGWHDDGSNPGKVVTLRNGMTINGTLDHRVWTRSMTGDEGWTRLEDLNPSLHYVALARGKADFGARSLGEEEAYTLGLFVADGCLIHGNKSQNLRLDKQDQVLKRIQPVLKEWSLLSGGRIGNASRYTTHSANHVSVSIAAPRFEQTLCYAYGPGTVGAYSHERTVPDAVLDGTRSTVVNFLRGYFDGDGYCDKTVSVSTSSRILAEQVIQLLLGLGVYCSLRVKRTTHLPANIIQVIDIESFHREIGLTGYGLKKDANYRALLAKPRNTNVDVVPGVGQLLRSCSHLMQSKYRRTDAWSAVQAYYSDRVPSYRKLEEFVSPLPECPERQELQRIINNHYAWVSISDIQDSTVPRIDCEVEHDHSFVGNGIVNHNTVCFSHLPEYLNMAPGEQMLVLVHRDELVWQSKEKLEKYNPHLHVDVEKAQYRCDHAADIVVASVATIGRNKRNEDGEWEWCERIKKFDRDSFRYVLIDECHHSTSPSYKGVMAYFRCLKGEPDECPDTYLLGVTATPSRSDNHGLESVYDSIAYNKDLREMIEEGWLSEIKAYRVDTSVDISDVKVQNGDFQVRQLEKTVNIPARNDLIVKKYRELGEDQRGVVFTVDVQHSEDIARTFNEAGVRAYALSGSTPEMERRKVLQLFREGYYRVLASCGVLLEGWDDPGVVVGMMARPTKSGLLYRQAVGRTLRPFPAPEEISTLRQQGREPVWQKQYSIILDFCDLSGRHTLHSVPTLFGLRSDFDAKGKKLLDSVKEMEKIVAQKRLPITPGEFRTIEDLKAYSERVDLLASPVIPESVKQYTKLAWVRSGPSSFQLCLPDYTILRVTENTLGKWEVTRSVKGVRTELGTYDSQRSAFSRADVSVPSDAMGTLLADAHWRSAEVTEKQAALLWRIKPAARIGKNPEEYFKFLKSKYSRGDVSNWITEAMRR